MKRLVKMVERYLEKREEERVIAEERFGMWQRIPYEPDQVEYKIYRKANDERLLF